MAAFDTRPPGSGLVWYDTWTAASPSSDQKTRRAWLSARGTIPDALTEPINGDDGVHYCIRAVGGLEVIAAEEVTRAGYHEVHALIGRVLFTTNEPTASVRDLRSALMLSLLCWASPAPTMPGEDEALGGVAPTPELKQARAVAWLARFEALVLEHMLPNLRALEAHWRVAVGHREDRIRFRVSVKRSGERSALCGASSQQMAALLGALVLEQLGWTVDLRDFDCEIVCAWNEQQVCVEVPISNRSVAGEAPLAEREYLRGGMQGPIAYSLALLARPTPYDVILDPMVGKGTLLLEASYLEPAGQYVGVDADADQLAAASENRGRAAAEQRERGAVGASRAQPGPSAAGTVELLRGDCTRLPIRSGSVDVVVADLPFGRRHQSADGAMGLPDLYWLAVGEMARVMREGGRAVAFTTHIRLLSKCVLAMPQWQPISRHEVQFGSLKAYACVFARQAPPPPLASRLVSDSADGIRRRTEHLLKLINEAARGLRRRDPLQRAVRAATGGTRRLCVFGHELELPIPTVQCAVAGGEGAGLPWVATAPADEVTRALEEVCCLPGRWRISRLQQLFGRDAAALDESAVRPLGISES